MNKLEVHQQRLMGELWRYARELNPYTQHKAAKELGLNVKYLRAIEKGVNCTDHPISASLVIKAAQLYEVSADFLLNLTGEEFEVDPVVFEQRRWGVHLHNETVEQLAKLAVVLNEQETKLGVITELITGLMKMQINADESLKRFIQLNQHYQDMRGGASLVHYSNEIIRAGGIIKIRLAKAKILHRD